MIQSEDGIFRLTTASTSYLFRVLPTGHLEHLYYGARLKEQELDALQTKITSGAGTSVVYGCEDAEFSLDRVTLEYSGIGKGDYRHSPIEVRMPDGSWVCDFVYAGHDVTEGVIPIEGLPSADGTADTCRTLTVELADRKLDVKLRLFYTVFARADVITRRTMLINDESEPLVIRRFMSMMVDLPDCDYELITLDGAWIREAHRHHRPLSYGLYVNESTTGTSSNRHNPGIVLARPATTEDAGECLALNLIYSGNHYEAVELSPGNTLRAMSGISPHCFEWELQTGERFETPEAVLSYSEDGFNRLSGNMHTFVNEHVVRGSHHKAERPVLFNTWEAYSFEFNTRKVLKLARAARDLGAELVVLDDGWFGERDSDAAGLGDYRVNTRKLPGGLARLARKITQMGLKFGLWFEPEMVNEDSELFRAHPDWAVQVPGREPSLGRNQLVLDLCRREVRDYIVENVNAVLRSAAISYVKWDMNRNLSDMYSPAVRRQGEFFHRYVLGLYDVIARVTAANPQILFEACASGGNRFDLGMLCYMPQIWASDNTDPIERLSIQGGLSLFYPPSVIGAHVSAAPHQQTLRSTPLPTRFNVAAFGVLGYELDPAHLTPAEKREIRAQIEFYKRHRRLLQYGRFLRFEPEDSNRVDWQTLSPDRLAAVRARFQILAEPAPAPERLRFKELDEEREYEVCTVPQTLSIRTFGALIKHGLQSLPVLRSLPVKPELHPDGFIFRLANRRFRLPNAVERYRAFGDLLRRGVRIREQFMGTGYNPRIRLVPDFGSTLYLATQTGAALQRSTDTANAGQPPQDFSCR